MTCPASPSQWVRYRNVSLQTAWPSAQSPHGVAYSYSTQTSPQTRRATIHSRLEIMNTDAMAKNTLFCPECGHQSEHDGDWTRIRGGRRCHYLCPECSTEITVRPTERVETHLMVPYQLLCTWTDSVQAWQEFWRDSMRHS